MLIGFDVGGTKIVSAYFKDRMSQPLRVPTPQSLPEFIAALDSLKNQFELEGSTVQSAAIGLPGQVERKQAVWIPNLPFLNKIPLAEILSNKWDCHVQLENDARLALLGEVWKGEGQGAHNIVLVTLGTGIGGAILADGQMIRGAHGTAGAIGWLALDKWDAGDSNHGFLERVASGTALNQAGSHLSTRRTSQELIRLARDGREESLVIIKRIGDYLGLGLASIASLLDPEIILVSGGLVEDLDLFLPHIREKLQQFASPSSRNIPIVKARLKDLAGLFGAIRLAQLAML